MMEVVVLLPLGGKLPITCHSNHEHLVMNGIEVFLHKLVIDQT